MNRLSLTIITWLFLLAPGWASVEVRIALDQSPPTSFLNDQGQADGFFPDLFDRAAARLDWSLTYVPCGWQQCLDLLDAGDIDILPGIAYTRERATRFRFSEETVLGSWGQIFSRADLNLSSILDLDDRTIAVLRGDVYLQGEHGLENIARQFDVDINLAPVDSYEEAFLKVASRQADAAMAGRIFGLKNRQKHNLVPIPILLNPIQARPAFSRHSSPDIAGDFEALLGQWKQDPSSDYYRLMDKWLGEKMQPRPPAWLQPLVSTVAAITVLLLITTLLTRKQVRIKTLELAEKNGELQKQLDDRKAIESELFERQQQYKVFFENSNSIIFFIDPDSGNIVDANDAASRFYQYTRAQLRCMKISQLNNLSATDLEKALRKARTSEQRHFEFMHQKANGEKCPVEVYATPIQFQGRTLLCSIVHDISQRKQTEQELADRTSFLQAVIDGVSDPLMVIARDHRILQMNHAAAELTQGHANQTLCCHNLSHDSDTPCSGADHPCPLQEVLASGEAVTMIHRHHTRQGDRICEVTASPLFDAEGQVEAIIEVVRDITERMQIEELLSENEKRLLHLAHHDSLTGLPNRLLFEDRLGQALSKARRRRQVALFFLDLDNFKAVNDNLGHDYGDRLLIDVGNRLRSCVRESDTVARMGGDEFLILLEEVDSIDMIEMTARRIGRALQHDIVEGEFRQSVSGSIGIGIAIYPEDAASGQDLLKNADIAMYKAKREGRANYQFFTAPQGRFIFD